MWELEGWLGLDCGGDELLGVMLKGNGTAFILLEDTVSSSPPYVKAPLVYHV
jgi:hypothetical protein